MIYGRAAEELSLVYDSFILELHTVISATLEMRISHTEDGSDM